MFKTVIGWLCESAWAITVPALEAIMRIAEREPDFVGNTELLRKAALSAKPGEAIPGTRYAYQRDGVGVLPIHGPIFPRSNLMTDFFGAVSAQMVAQDFSSMMDNPGIKSILLDVDSPGGAITGTSELASLIYGSRGKKPIVAFVSGMGASAAYWIASAADSVIISDTGEVGSIGVVATYRDTSKQEEKSGIQNIEIVSSQSPLKRVRPTTDEGRAKIQRLVDAAADVFISAVAMHRGVDIKTVEDDFGKGDLFLGAQAVTQGLADDVGTFEEVLISMCDKYKSKPRKEFIMNKAQETNKEVGQDAIVTYTVEGIREGSPETFESIKALGRKEGAEAERKRILDIQALSIPGAEKLISDALGNPDMTAEKVAVEIVKMHQQKTAQVISSVTADARALTGVAEQIAPATTAGISSGSDKETERKAAAANIAAGANTRRQAATR